MKNILTLLALVLLCNQASSATVQCPALIKTNQSLQEPIKGWDGFVDDLNAVHTFNRVTFYAGPPKEQASLSPDESPKDKKLTWTFGKEKIWLACGYSNTLMQLVQPLPDNTKRCSVTYNADLSQVKTIQCN
jgi:hypothetical protein